MLFWVGPRESDIDDTENIFDGAITLFGEEKGDNSSAFCNYYHSRVNHNPESVSLTSKLFRRKLFDVNKSAMFVFCKAIPNNPIKMA